MAGPGRAGRGTPASGGSSRAPQSPGWHLSPSPPPPGGGRGCRALRAPPWEPPAEGAPAVGASCPGSRGAVLGARDRPDRRGVSGAGVGDNGGVGGGWRRPPPLGSPRLLPPRARLRIRRGSWRRVPGEGMNCFANGCCGRELQLFPSGAVDSLSPQTLFLKNYYRSWKEEAACV